MLISAPPPCCAQKLLFSEQSTIEASGQWSPNPAGGREMLAIASFVAFPSLLAYGLPRPTLQEIHIDAHEMIMQSLSWDLANRIIIITGDELE